MNLIHACPEVAMIYRRRKNTYQNTAVNNQGKKNTQFISEAKV